MALGQPALLLSRRFIVDILPLGWLENRWHLYVHAGKIADYFEGCALWTESIKESMFVLPEINTATFRTEFQHDAFGTRNVYASSFT